MHLCRRRSCKRRLRLYRLFLIFGVSSGSWSGSRAPPTFLGSKDKIPDRFGTSSLAKISLALQLNSVTILTLLSVALRCCDADDDADR